MSPSFEDRAGAGTSMDPEIVDLDLFLKEALQRGLEQVGATQGSLMLLNKREKVLEIMERCGPDYDLKKKYKQFKSGEGIAGLVVLKCQPYFTGDVRSDPAFKPARGVLNFVSLIAVPIVSLEGKAIGVICADSPETDKFNQGHVERLAKLGRMVGLSVSGVLLDSFISYLKRVRLLESLHTVGRKLSQLTFESPQDLPGLLREIAQLAEQVLEADLLTLYQYYPQTDTFEPCIYHSGNFSASQFMGQAVHPGDAPYRIVAKSEPYYCIDVGGDSVMRARGTVPASDTLPERKPFVDREGVISAAGIQLKAAGEIVGVVFVNYRSPHSFPEEEKHAIETFFDYVALAILGARRVQEFLRARQNALQFLAGKVAHDMGTGLVAIDGDLKLYLEGKNLADEPDLDLCYNALDITQVELSAGRDLLTLSQPFDCSDRLPVSELVARLGEALRIYVTHRGHPLVTVDHQLPVVFVQVNFDKLRHSFWNFAHDSIRHRSEGLRVGISCELAAETDLEVAGLKGPERASTYVKLIYFDNGAGVPEKFKETIFELGAGVPGSPGGAGIGLPAARRVAEAHRGALLERGKQGEGVRFEFYLPVAPFPEQ